MSVIGYDRDGEFTPPLLPYAGTSGHSGSETSEQRARTEDSNGTTSKRQRLAVAQADNARGVTVKELRERLGWHHGQASSALSVLHKEGRLVRLADTRDRSKVYVSPRYVLGRDTEPHGRRRAALPGNVQEAIDRLRTALDHNGPITSVDIYTAINHLEGQ